MPLTTDEMRFFKRNGYLIKRGVLDPDLMERARARLWDGAPPGRRRDDPATWVGPFREDEENADRDNHRRGFRWNFREPGGEPWMVRLLATDPTVWAMAEQMLGEGQLGQPARIRGIYCTLLPYGDHPPQALGCHTDAHPFHLGVVGYIDDVPPNGGSFMVWPESHRAFYPTFTSQYLRDQDEAAYERVRAALQPAHPRRHPRPDRRHRLLAPPPRPHGQPQHLAPAAPGGALRFRQEGHRANPAGLTKDAVHRIWRTYGLQPHRHKHFKLSSDPFLCVDEKSQIQALERSQPMLPLGLGYVEGIAHDYKRPGTTTLLAALDVATGEVMTQCKSRHRHQEFLQFLCHIEANVPEDLDVHLVVDNYATHKHAKARWRSGSVSSPVKRFGAVRFGRYRSWSSGSNGTPPNGTPTPSPSSGRLRPIPSSPKSRDFVSESLRHDTLYIKR